MSNNQQRYHDALRVLRDVYQLKAGATIYTTLKYVSPNGMRRRVSVFIAHDSKIVCIDYYVANLLCRSVATDGGIVCTGAGLDVGFELVYRMGRHMFVGGFGVPMRRPPSSVETCPSSAEEAAAWASQGFRGRGRNGDQSGWDNDGGYAFNQQWI